MSATYGTLVEAIGVEATDKLINAFGGCRLWIPVSDNARLHPPNRTHHADKLKAILDSQTATALSHAFGGDYLDIPSARNVSAQRDRLIVAKLHREGKSINAMAETVHRSRSTIFRWLNAPRNRR